MVSEVVRMQPSRWLLTSMMQWLPAYLETVMTGVAGFSETFIHTYNTTQCHSPKYHKPYLNSKLFYVHMGNSCVLHAHFYFTDSPLHPSVKTDSLGSFQLSWEAMEINVCIWQCNLPNIMEQKYEVPIVIAYSNWTTIQASVFIHVCVVLQ